MQEFLLWLENGLAKVNDVLADYILVILLVGVGLFYTIRTKFVQVRCFGQGMKKVFGNIKLNGAKQIILLSYWTKLIKWGAIGAAIRSLRCWKF